MKKKLTSAIDIRMKKYNVNYSVWNLENNKRDSKVDDLNPVLLGVVMTLQIYGPKAHFIRAPSWSYIAIKAQLESQDEVDVILRDTPSISDSPLNFRNDLNL